MLVTVLHIQGGVLTDADTLMEEVKLNRFQTDRVKLFTIQHVGVNTCDTDYSQCGDHSWKA